MRLRYILTAAVLAALTIAMAASAATGDTRTTKTASAASPYCGFYWGSVPEAHEATGVAPLTNVRAGRHGCYDRLVLDMSGKADGYRVDYVPEITMDGSGDIVPLRGGARLLVVAYAPAHDNYVTTYAPANPRELVGVTGWQTFRQIAWAGSFEGQSSIGLGVRARLPFRVFTLDGPGAGSRIVIDVAHFW
jgi:hypothetical protein